MFPLIVIVVVAAIVIYHYYHSILDYLPSKGIRIPPAELVFGHTRQLFKINDPRILKYREWGKKYGKSYGIYEGVTKVLVTSDISILQEVFVKQFDNFYSRKVVPINPNPDTDEKTNLFHSRGARWKRFRIISSPSFSTNSLKKILPVVQDSVINMVKIMEERHFDGKPFNIHEFFMEYTMDTICRLTLGQKESRYFRNPKVAVAKAIFLQHIDTPLLHFNYAMPFLNAPCAYLIENVVKTPMTTARRALFRC